MTTRHIVSGVDRSRPTTPNKSPEAGGYDNCDCRKTHITAVQPWLNCLARDGLQYGEQTECPQKLRPARIDRESERQGQQGGDGHADIGHKAEHGRDQPPKGGIGHPDRPQSNTDRRTENGVDRGLQEQIAAQPFGAVVECCRRALQIARTGEHDEAIAQIFFLQQDENHEDDDDRQVG